MSYCCAESVEMNRSKQSKQRSSIAAVSLRILFILVLVFGPPRYLGGYGLSGGCAEDGEGCRSPAFDARAAHTAETSLIRVPEIMVAGFEREVGRDPDD